MSKTIIGTIVGGLILFIWQFISWGPGDIHGSQMQYTPAQDAVLKCLAENNVAEGAYFLPRASDTKENHEYMQQHLGKPWATLQYHHKLSDSFAMNLIRGFVINILAVFLLIWIIGDNPNLSFIRVFLSSLFIGVIGYLTIPYLDSVWFESNSIPNLIDAIVPWSLVGAFLGWLLTRGNN